MSHVYGCFGLDVYGLTLTETGAFGRSTRPSTAQVPTTMNQLQLQVCPDRVKEREMKERESKPVGNAAISKSVLEVAHLCLD